MSSDSNKQDSAGSAAGTEARAGATAPSWGAARDALAGFHNLVALLRNQGVPQQTLVDLLPELRSSTNLLRAAFGSSREPDRTAGEVAAAGLGQIDQLDSLLDSIAAGAEPREDLSSRLASLADDLEALADLLALLERAASPVPTEVSLDLVASEAGRVSGSARGKELAVRFDRASAECTVRTDPFLLGPLLSLVAARTRAAGLESLVVRTRSVPGPHFVVEGAREADAALPSLSMRVLPWLAPSEGVVGRVAEALGARLDLSEERCTITLAAAD
ncbi:MAG TPA: hypothetical protein VKU41_26085 [Polyangiaceae bacterium]|nr:hypothetical protein [Polyangiaceae bacterium]